MTIQAHRPVEVGPGHPASRADLTQFLALLNRLTNLDIDLAHVRIQADQTLAVVEIDHIA